MAEFPRFYPITSPFVVINVTLKLRIHSGTAISFNQSTCIISQYRCLRMTSQSLSTTTTLCLKVGYALQMAIVYQKNHLEASNVGVFLYPPVN